MSSNILISAYAQSDFFGQLIIASLIVLSLLCWLVLLQKSWQVRTVQRLSKSFCNAIHSSTSPVLHIDLHAMPQPSSKQVPHPFHRIFVALKKKTLELLEKNHFFLSQHHPQKAVFLSSEDLELIESHVITTMTQEIHILERHIPILSTIVTLAPFLGLLGTVWGILVTFSNLQTGASIHANSLILGGISTALVTTVMGLCVAIPALIAHHFLKARLRLLTVDMEHFCYQLFDQIAVEYRQVEIK